MEPWRSLALLASSLGLISSLIALSTDFWIVATGHNFSAHSGLWPTSQGIQVAGKGAMGSLVVGMCSGDRHPDTLSRTRLYPCDTELLYPGCPVGPGVRELPGSVLHPGPVCSRPWPFGLNCHGFCCRYEWDLGCTGTPGLVNSAVAKPAQLSLVLVRSCLHISGHGSVYQYEMEPESISPGPDFLLLVLLPRLDLLHPLPLCR